MAIIIDEQMPKACYECNFRCGINFLTFVNTEDKRHPDCPIIGEIPDKHGDLIDRSELLQQFEHDTSRPTGYEVVTRIMNAPVVLERTT